jgi:NADH pyrophosphatase NudC (nudix superfamily)
MPDGWLYYEEDDKSILNCKKCKKEHFPDIDPETGEKAIYIAS